jgi:hypothetical protein
MGAVCLLEHVAYAVLLANDRVNEKSQ